MNQDTFLIEPSIEFEAAFKQAVEDFKRADEEESATFYESAMVNFADYVRELHDYAKGVNLPEGWMHGSTYWLTDSTSEILGIVRIRHEYIPMGHIGYDVPPSHRRKGYGTLILKLALEKAKQLSINPVIVACNSDNVASAKIIEKNGGRLWDEATDGTDGKRVKRYRIYLWTP